MIVWTYLTRGPPWEVGLLWLQADFESDKRGDVPRSVHINAVPLIFSWLTDMLAFWSIGQRDSCNSMDYLFGFGGPGSGLSRVDQAFWSKFPIFNYQTTINTYKYISYNWIELPLTLCCYFFLNSNHQHLQRWREKLSEIVASTVSTQNHRPLRLQYIGTVRFLDCTPIESARRSQKRR